MGCKMKWLGGYRTRLMLIGFVVCGLLSMVSVCSALEYVWTQKTDMPSPRWRHSTCVVNGKIYVIGGTTSEPNPELVWPVEVYDPATDTWTEKADMLTGRAVLATSVVDGKIYAIGGANGPGASLPTVEEYDPATDTWTPKADMSAPRDCIAAVTVDRRIYAIGGDRGMSWVGLETVEAYDPATDTWERRADMPLGVLMLCAHVVNGKIYAVGGRPDLKARAYVQEYDPTTDTWTRKSDMPLRTSQMASVVLGNKIIVIGGWEWSRDYPYRTIQIYDPDTDSWTIEGDALFVRACFTADVVNNRIYTIGGTYKPHPCPATATVHELTIDPPTSDFNGDGIIDVKDIVIMTHYWGSRYALCDIGPTPLGDGIVDVRDLLILIEDIEPEEREPGLIAHWKLDEIDGCMAYDSVSGEDAFTIGDPQWHQNGGILDGALELDGIDDFISTDFVLDPAGSVFSVIVWMKGVAPGQVILSQADGASWLCSDPVEGCLMTELTGYGRSSAPLMSQSCVTDGQWHRIGLIWDSSYRHLYVDGEEVATDEIELPGLVGSDGGLFMGTGSLQIPGTFFSGLIDDVRIYNRAVSP